MEKVSYLEDGSDGSWNGMMLCSALLSSQTSNLGKQHIHTHMLILSFSSVPLNASISLSFFHQQLSKSAWFELKSFSSPFRIATLSSDRSLGWTASSCLQWWIRCRMATMAIGQRISPRWIQPMAPRTWGDFGESLARKPLWKIQ